MESLTLPTEEEIRAVTREGEETVVALVSSLVEAIALLSGYGFRVLLQNCFRSDP